MSAVPRASHQGRLYRIVLLLIGVAMLVPIWSVNYPGMVDYPNHLARCYILAHYHADPIWQTRYLVLHGPLPDLAIDLIVTPLNHFLPILLSGKIFLTFTALLYGAGCVWLGRAILGRRSWIAPFAALTFYNSALLFGFLNYIFGIAVFLCAFAFWLQSRNRISWPRFVVLCLLSIVAYLSHLSSIAFLGVSCLTIALLELPRHRSLTLLIRQLAWLLCPVLLMAAFMNRSGQVGAIEWSTLTQKFTFLFAPVRTYNLVFDAALLVVLLVCAFVIAKGARVHRTAVAGAVLFFLFLITPNAIFNSSAADARYIIPAYLVLLLSVEPTWRRAQTCAIAVATLAMVVRTADIAVTWRTIDHREQRVLQMGDALPAGARIFVFRSDFTTSAKLNRGFFQVIDLWAISHDASLSTLFATRGMQPLVRRQPVCNIQKSSACLGDYDYIWTDNPPSATEQLIHSIADPAVVWQSVTLWRVRR